MARRLKIPDQLLVLNPKFNIKEIRTILNVILNSRRNRMRQAYIFDIRLPNLGRIRSRANKVHKHSKKTLTRDRTRKRREAKEKDLNKTNLLW